jgi:hypothetical protein
MIDLSTPTAAATAHRLAADGVLVVPFTAARLRAVTHLDIDDAAVERAGAVLRRALMDAGAGSGVRRR